jgi:hypothetical protein
MSYYPSVSARFHHYFDQPLRGQPVNTTTPVKRGAHRAATRRVPATRIRRAGSPRRLL